MADRLAKRLDLTDEELRFLDSLGAETTRYRRGQVIQRAGERAGHAYVLKSGWAVTLSDFPDGSRQVRRLHLPSDLLGMPSMAMQHHVADIEAVSDVVVAPFRKASLAILIQRYPRLAAIMFMFAQEERVTFGDRLCSLSRLPCKGRMAFLLMDVLTRLRKVDPEVSFSFEMHLTRAQMGEITGMTAVHASRMWSELMAEGAIGREGEFVTIRDEARLVGLSGFVDRSLDLDFGWLPS